MKKNIGIGILLFVVLLIGGTSGFLAGKNLIDKEKNEKVEENNTVHHFSNDWNVDILTRHALPTLDRMQKEDQSKFVDSLQVMKKMEQLSIDKNHFLYPELNFASAEKICNENKIYTSSVEKQIVYEGNSSLELQKIIDENPNTIISIQSEIIEVTESIQLTSNTYLIGNHTEFIGKGVEIIFLANGVENVLIDSIQISGEVDFGIYILNSKKVGIKNSSIQGLKQKPICVIGENQFIEISNNVLDKNEAGGIWISGNTSYCLIEKNTIMDNNGTSNWMAGLVLTNIKLQNEKNIWETFDSTHHFPYKENLYAQLECPHEMIVRKNEIKNNNASGIYSDGAYACYIVENHVKGNDKEGICLDYGTIGFYLKENIFDGNGERMRQTDKDLEMDFVLNAGRMENGSAKSKLPGISLDNTAYNILENNLVINNFGGGIKMVRTTVRSLIIENVIKDNNQGQNDVFHFFGIEIGAALADVESTDMDFTPDYENIICRNVISGDHYSGVFIGEECYVNDVFDNVIMEPQMFAIEAISLKFNSIVNNLSNANSRNEYHSEEN